MPKKQFRNSTILRSALVALVVIGLVGGAAKVTHANRYNEQIRALNNQNAAAQSVVNGLQSEATSYQDAINRLQGQIDALRGQIASNQAQQAQLQTQITQNQAQISAKKSDLAATIKAMYIDGSPTTLEQLATSKNLSDYVDKEEYRTSVQNDLSGKIREIAALQAKLQKQKSTLDTLAKTLESQNAQLGSDQNQQNQMLAYNQGQQAAYNSQISANSSRIAELKRQQALENIRLFGGSASGGTIGGGGYPWGNAPCIHTGKVSGACPNYDWGINGQIYNFSLGGYGYRNCTDWVAFRVKAAGGNVPGGLGNAKTWDDRAPSYGYGVGGTPKVGAAAVSNSGTYGHVMYVEAVNGNGSITVSDYNKAGTGKYDSYTISAGVASSLRYVYFK